MRPSQTPSGAFGTQMSLHFHKKINTCQESVKSGQAATKKQESRREERQMDTENFLGEWA